MKLFATVYTAMPLEELVQSICSAQWSCEKISDTEYSLQGDGVQLTVEGGGDVLMFGEVKLELSEIDLWVAGFAKLSMSYNIDLHADEARLIRRYQQ
ncbi:MAG: hypothetical protein OFPI_05060 [Osedax symbiont Rs2]|nr:MAG: hypothetical protein OFPI_05060 [Osedax symbiont Rs2]